MTGNICKEKIGSFLVVLMGLVLEVSFRSHSLVLQLVLCLWGKNAANLKNFFKGQYHSIVNSVFKQIADVMQKLLDKIL